MVEFNVPRYYCRPQGAVYLPKIMMNIPNGPSDPAPIRRIKTLQWIVRPLEVLEERAKRYGDTFVVSKNTLPLIVFFSHPKAIQQIFNADPKLFDVGSGNDILLPLVGANSLILLDGDRHQRQQRLLMPPFHGDGGQAPACASACVPMGS